jgi:hypothetical protein
MAELVRGFGEALNEKNRFFARGRGGRMAFLIVDAHGIDVLGGRAVLK